MILLLILFYTRFIGLNWGLPYPMHPDEWNMATAIQGLNCRVQGSRFKIRDCFNPHFFAYGQLPLYAGYLLVQLYHFIIGKVGLPITFEEAAMSLRVISAAASIVNVFVLIEIIKFLIFNFQYSELMITFLIFTFSPYFIQFSHLGTTESLLMLFYSLIIYGSLQYINKSKWKNVFLLSLFCGLAVATKVSAIFFLFVPGIALISNLPRKNFSEIQRGRHIKYQKLFILNRRTIKQLSNLIIHLLKISSCLFLFLSLSFVFAVLFSPHNLISFQEFLGSMNYESAVALGDARVFYTRQFEQTVPVLFQLMKIFPYTLGWPVFILGGLGLFGLSWRDRKVNLLRLAFLIYFLPNAFLYAKWTRFMTPILPIMSIFSLLVLFNVYKKLASFSWRKLKTTIKNPKYFNFSLNILYFIFYILFLIPGIAYLSIYQNPDVRFVASKWIYENIPENSYILFETANVVDVPIEVKSQFASWRTKIKSYKSISFNFYDLDTNPLLQEEFHNHLARADYIFVPSRRVFTNHTCFRNIKYQILNIKYTDQISNIEEKKNCHKLEEKYPLLNDYYQRLFSGELGFKKVAEFSSYPKISFFGKTLVEFPDEEAEETWTVFDHPVIRIYKRV